MYAQDLEIKVDSVIQELEMLANWPPRLCWDGGTRSRSEMSASRSWEQGFGDVTRPDVTQVRRNDLFFGSKDSRMSVGL